MRLLAFKVVPQFGHCERHRRIHLIVSLSTFSLSLIKSTEPSEPKRSHISIATIRMMISNINAITIAEQGEKSRAHLFPYSREEIGKWATLVTIIIISSREQFF